MALAICFSAFSEPPSDSAWLANALPARAGKRVEGLDRVGVLHAGHGLQARLDDTVDQVGDLQRRQRLAAEGEPDGRRGVGLDLGDDRLSKRGNASFQAYLDKTMIAFHILLRN